MSGECGNGYDVPINNKSLVEIHFRNNEDFRNRIAALWQNQKENESYVFSFGDEEAEREFECLIKAFNPKGYSQ